MSGHERILKRTGAITSDRFHVLFTDLVLSGTGREALVFTIGEARIQREIELIPGILTILPSLLAIFLAFITRQVILSLLVGVWLGAFFIYDFNPITSFYRLADTVIIGALNDIDHLMILVFSLMLGGMVGIISRAGGTYGIVNLVARYARTPRSAQTATWFMGLLIFFDDYSNTLLVGNTMRAFTDRLKISREKLSYIVDSTAAPVTCIAVITTWIGTEIGLINDLNLPSVDGFHTFISALPYNFYPFLAILMVLFIATLQRDFGPMLQAEQRARSTGKLLADTAVPLVDDELNAIAAADDVPPRWYNAVIPIVTVIVVIIVGLYIDGRAALGTAGSDASLSNIFGAANSLKVLMWGSFTGVFVAAGLVLVQRLLDLRTVVESWLTGLKSMTIAMIILVLAWSLTSICMELKTASFVAFITKDLLSAHLLPLMTFVIAAFIGFATGTSWGTMGILVPIVLPLSLQLAEVQGLPGIIAESVFLSTVAAVLSGSVFGDHCSPISDTTIMSSMASGSDHIDHVRTQLPYAALAGVTACIMGYLPAGYGIPPLISLAISVTFLFIFLKLFGKDPGAFSLQPPAEETAGLTPPMAE
ncbi:MAG: Na+/H+ antiporter NhaC family protein [Acidobacteria bacterium]|nr:Na+/H+ antiporter NhaC family protein [Acidobacteriota bacterium]